MYRIKLVLLSILCFIGITGFSQKRYYVSTLAGDTTNLATSPFLNANAGYKDGVASQALFNGPTGIAVDTAGNVYVADTYNNVIRKVNVLFNTVTTIAGDTTDIKKGLDSNIGYMNGSALSAKFSNPIGICVDKDGNVYVADTYNNVIRKITTSGVVSTYAGKQDSSGIVTYFGYVDGPDSTAEFFAPTSLSIDASGNIYVADEGNNVIRKIWAIGDSVSTIAGRGHDTAGYINGAIDTALFTTVFGVTYDKKGAVYVSQFGDGANAIRRIYNDTVTTYVGYDTAGFDTNVLAPPYTIPIGYQNGKDTDSRGDTSIVGILFNGPAGISFDTAGNLLIADEYNNVIRLYNTKDSIASTFAGNHSNDTVSFHNGWDTLAVIYNPMGVVADKVGNVYVSDLGNNLIRKIKLQSITAVPQVKKQEYTLHAYPNPCSDRLNIVSNYNGKADLLDVTSRVIWTNDNFKSPYILNTSDVAPGVYFLRITSANQTLIQKVEVIK